MDCITLTQNLVRCPSVTPEEGGALRLLDDVLRPAGFTCHLLTFAEPHTEKVTNLYARLGTGAPYLLFAGHTDVVPPGPESAWIYPPFSATLADGKLFGRGAEDMKSGVAAAVCAALGFLNDKGVPNGSIGFLITGDEEGPAVNGTPATLRWAHAQGERFDHCVVAEPSSKDHVADTMKVGRRGSFTATLRVQGVQGHVAYQHKANNPIPHLFRCAEALLAPLDQGNALFQPSNLECVDLHVGNTVSNVIPGVAEMRFNVRFNDSWTLDSLEHELRQRLSAVEMTASWSLEIGAGNSEAFRTETGAFTDLVAAATRQITGRAPVQSTGGGTSDARFIKSYCPVVELGLISATLHQVNEHAPVADIEALTRIYRRLIDLYFA